MIAVEDCALCNSVLYERFFATTELLAKLVSSAPRALSIAQMEAATGRSVKELMKLCRNLMRANLLRQEVGAADKWVLTCSPCMVTLEDVFRCVLAEQQGRSKPAAKTNVPERTPNDVDLLLMQAMIAINQSVFKHLRQFSLDRLKISSAGMFPVSRRPLSASCFDEVLDAAMPGHKLHFTSSVQMAV